MLQRARDRWTAHRLRGCALFDAAYYRNAYADVATSGLDPALHFATVGGPQLRNAHRDVESRRLLALAPPFRPGVDNPLLFLAAHRPVDTGDRPHRGATTELPLAPLLAALESEPGGDRLPASCVVDIIVPIHNNAEKLQALLSTLAISTAPRHRVVLIDDASTDPQVEAVIAAFSAARTTTVVLRNQRNLGYAASVNAGLTASGNHKIVLNSDTLVPPGWVDAMVAPLLHDRDVASVTPFSNSSSVTGFPAARIEVPVPAPHELEAVNDALRQLPHRDHAILTGVGFCMAMAPQVLDEIGPLDEEAFRGGYYEDTEWCYRARKAGYRNVLANRLLVAHDHLSASFGLAAKLQALGRSEREMNRKHPDYGAEMEAAYFADAERELRASGLLLAACRLEPPFAVVSAQGGAEADVLARAAYASAATVLELSGEGETCSFTCHSARYGRLDFGGRWSEAAGVLKHLAPRRVVLGHLPPAAEAAFARAGSAARLAGGECAVTHTAGAPGVPPDLLASCELPEPSLPFTVAVLGTPAHGTQPPLVERLLEHIAASGAECRVVLFGEVPDAWLTRPNVLKTGLYRTENVPFLLRHYRVSVAWFATTRDGSFECTRLDALAAGLPVVSHDRGPLGAMAPDHERWTIVAGREPGATLAALRAEHRKAWGSL